MPTQHTVVVYFDKCLPKVAPGHLLVKRGDAIKIKVLGRGMQIFLPESGPFTKLPLNSHFDLRANVLLPEGIIFQIPPEGFAEFVVKDDADLGRYPYAAYSKDLKSFAVGGSDPEIIIYE